jgi:hypothetical protein
LLQKSAAQGRPKPQHTLGMIHFRGRGVKKDYVEAVKYFQLSATQGDIGSQYYLGVCYEKGKGVKKDLAEAAKWYGEAAKQGDAEAIRKVAKLKKMGF